MQRTTAVWCWTVKTTTATRTSWSSVWASWPPAWKASRSACARERRSKRLWRPRARPPNHPTRRRRSSEPRPSWRRTKRKTKWKPRGRRASTSVALSVFVCRFMFLRLFLKKKKHGTLFWESVNRWSNIRFLKDVPWLWVLNRRRSEGNSWETGFSHPIDWKCSDFILLMSPYCIIFSYCMFNRFSHRPFMSPFSIRHLSWCQFCLRHSPAVSGIGHTTQETLNETHWKPFGGYFNRVCVI